MRKNKSKDTEYIKLVSQGMIVRIVRTKCNY